DVPSPSTTGNVYIAWGASPTADVTYNLELAYSPDFSDAFPLYTGSNTSYTLTDRGLGDYYFRVKVTKSGFGDSAWNDSGYCQVTRLGKPNWIDIPSPSVTGNVYISWATSPTADVTYVLEIAYAADFSGAFPLYTGSDTGFMLGNRPDGDYYFRVKATKSGFGDSAWNDGGYCLVDKP
ncbi:MAG: hypothetical protein RQ754_10450, partial [Desulfuromonadales bacterium]|nr:hypothetical protein [Desulfuromonadales bacterium]